MDDQVFVLRNGYDEEWKVYFNGKVLPTSWPDKGSALAGLDTARWRFKKLQEKHQNSEKVMH